MKGHQTILRLIGIGVAVGVFGNSYDTLLPIFTDVALKGGAGSYSLLLLSIGIGGLVGTVLLASIGNLKNSGKLLIVTGIAFSLGLVAFSSATWLPVAVAVMGITGGFGAVFLTVNNTLIQSLASDEFRGRVMSVHQLSWGATALEGLLMGFLAEAVNAPFALMLDGIASALAIISIGLPLLRGLSIEPQLEQPSVEFRPSAETKVSGDN